MMIAQLLCHRRTRFQVPGFRELQFRAALSPLLANSRHSIILAGFPTVQVTLLPLAIMLMPAWTSTEPMASIRLAERPLPAGFSISSMPPAALLVKKRPPARITEWVWLPTCSFGPIDTTTGFINTDSLNKLAISKIIISDAVD